MEWQDKEEEGGRDEERSGDEGRGDIIQEQAQGHEQYVTLLTLQL